MSTGIGSRHKQCISLQLELKLEDHISSYLLNAPCSDFIAQNAWGTRAYDLGEQRELGNRSSYQVSRYGPNQVRRARVPIPEHGLVRRCADEILVHVISELMLANQGRH